MESGGGAGWTGAGSRCRRPAERSGSAPDVAAEGLEMMEVAALLSRFRGIDEEMAAF